MRKLSRSTLTLAVAGLAGTLLLGACQTSGPTRKENMLSAARFKMVVADTPDKLASLQKLPPNRFQPKTINGQTMFLYADPVVCRRFFDVLNLLAPPAALLAPAIAWRVLGRRAPPGPGSPRPAAAAA